ncbi:MAG: helix-turn-helix domain-containing protein [Ardenticatenaceae bacterium]
MKRPNMAAHLLAYVLVYIASRVALAAVHVAPPIEGKLVPPTVMKTHRIRLNPLNSQEDYFNRASGTARFAYNWGLARFNEMFAAGEKPSAPRLRGEK